jgi:hypothetical protein
VCRFSISKITATRSGFPKAFSDFTGILISLTPQETYGTVGSPPGRADKEVRCDQCVHNGQIMAVDSPFRAWLKSLLGSRTTDGPCGLGAGQLVFETRRQQAPASSVHRSVGRIDQLLRSTWDRDSVQSSRANTGSWPQVVPIFVVQPIGPARRCEQSSTRRSRPGGPENSGGAREMRTPGRRTPQRGNDPPWRGRRLPTITALNPCDGACQRGITEGDCCMPPALREGPCGLICAAATSDSGCSRTGPDHIAAPFAASPRCGAYGRRR